MEDAKCQIFLKGGPQMKATYQITAGVGVVQLSHLSDTLIICLPVFGTFPQ